MLRLMLLIGLCVGVTGCATPYGERGILGGVQHERIENSLYRMRTGLNGYSNTAMFKPFFAARAREIAETQGYLSALVERLDYVASTDGSSMTLIVQFLQTRAKCTPDDWKCLPLDQPLPRSAASQVISPLGRTTLRPSDESRRIGQFIRVSPIFISAIEAEADGFGRNAMILPPGRHEFVAAVSVPRGVLQTFRKYTAIVHADLTDGTAYVINAEREGEEISVWVSDEKTRTPAGPKTRFIP